MNKQELVKIFNQTGSNLYELYDELTPDSQRRILEILDRLNAIGTDISNR